MSRCAGQGRAGGDREDAENCGLFALRAVQAADPLCPVAIECDDGVARASAVCGHGVVGLGGGQGDLRGVRNGRDGEVDAEIGHSGRFRRKNAGRVARQALKRGEAAFREPPRGPPLPANQATKQTTDDAEIDRAGGETFKNSRKIFASRRRRGGREPLSNPWAYGDWVVLRAIGLWDLHRAAGALLMERVRSPARVAESADAVDSKSTDESLVGSTPTPGTNF